MEPATRRGLSTDVGSTCTQHQMRFDPNEVRRLTPGMCIAIGNGKGKGEKLQIAPPPPAEAEYPRRDIFARPKPAPEDPSGPDEPIRL